MIILLPAVFALSVQIIDHSGAVRARPITGKVVACSSPTGLPLARLAERSADAGGPDYGLDKLMDAGGCMTVINTKPFQIDFQEDVAWVGALSPPRVLHGTLRVARGRISLDGVMPGLSGIDG